MNKDFNIEDFLSLEGYATAERKARRKGSGGTQEFFTPFSLLKKMIDKIPEYKWNNPESTFLEPCMGSGQFVIYIIYNKMKHGSTWEQALSTTYGVDIMESNVQEVYSRVLDMLNQIAIDLDEDKAMQIMKHNLVCSDFFDWDFQNWCPIKKTVPLF